MNSPIDKNLYSLVLDGTRRSTRDIEFTARDLLGDTIDIINKKCSQGQQIIITPRIK